MTITNGNRRMTLSGIPSHSSRNNNNNNRRDSMMIPPSSPGGGASTTSSKTRNSRQSRKSMIPTLGRENAPPIISSDNTVHSNTGKGNQSANEGNGTSTRISNRRRSSILPPSGITNNDGSNRTNDRRMSILPPAPPNLKNEKDPRITSDNKALQQKCIRDLLNFLLDNEYPYPVSQKSLSRPSAKEFSNILTFMLRMVDPNFQHGSTMKFEDEAALNFKCLGYPCAISKTALVAAGTAHTWPALLAALTWLMERLQSKILDKEEDLLHNPNGTEFETIDELAIKAETAFYQYLGKSYAAFLTENMNELERLEIALSDRFTKDDEVLERHIESITDVNAKCLDQIRELEMASAELPAYIKKREDYATDLEQFHDLIRQMDEHKTALEKKVKEKNIELKKTNEQLDKMSRHVDELKRTIATQELSVDDVQKVETELKGLKESIDRNSAIKEQRRKNLTVHEEELSKFCSQVETAVNTFNTKLIALLDIHDLSGHFKSFKLQFKPDNLLLQDQRQIVGVDIQKQIHSLVIKFQDDYVQKFSNAKEQHHDELDAMEHSDELNKVAKEQLSVVNEKKMKLEQTLESESETNNATLAVHQREVEALEQKVESLRNPIALEEQMASYERQCAELESIRIDHQEENIAKKKAVIAEITAACTAMKEHDDNFRATVSKVADYWNEKRETIRSLRIKSSVEV